MRDAPAQIKALSRARAPSPPLPHLCDAEGVFLRIRSHPGSKKKRKEISCGGVNVLSHLFMVSESEPKRCAKSASATPRCGPGRLASDASAPMRSVILSALIHLDRQSSRCAGSSNSARRPSDAFFSARRALPAVSGTYATPAPAASHSARASSSSARRPAASALLANLTTAWMASGSATSTMSASSFSLGSISVRACQWDKQQGNEEGAHQATIEGRARWRFAPARSAVGRASMHKAH